VLSKTSATDLDFTWVSPTAGDIEGVTAGVGISGGGTSGTVTITNDMATTITAAGDIVVGTGSGTYDNLPIGTTNQILTADTTVSPYKVKWATPAGGGGKVLQVVSAVTSSQASITSTTVFGDTNITATITPTSATSKVLILISANQSFGSSTSNTIGGIQTKLLRGATVLFHNDKATLIEWSSVADKGLLQTCGYTYLDSPATTSATTYKMTAAAIYANQTVLFQYGSVNTSTITLLEIGA
jgi:hypothetical protein